MIHRYKPQRNQYAHISIPFFVLCVILAGTSIAYAGGNKGDGINTPYRASNDARRFEFFQNNKGTYLEYGRENKPSDPCGLEAVECEGEKTLPPTRSGLSDSFVHVSAGVVAGYRIESYATLPTHEATVKAIYDSIPEIADKFQADAYIKSKRPTSPVTGGMVERAAKEYGVDMKLMLALMQNDSAFGTEGVGARTHNPGNIANRDDGHTFTYPSWEDGVRGVARWLAKNRI